MRQYDWDDFDKFSNLIGVYMPYGGQGETQASQICTAVNKLVYRWFNDGDVYDESCVFGYVNDMLCSCANWLAKYAWGCNELLDRIYECETADDYTVLLYDLCEILINADLLKLANKKEKTGSIYSCDGKYHDADDDDFYR